MTTYPPGQFVDEAGRAHVPFSTGTTAAPTDGTWAVGNLAVTTTGTVYACTVAGTPGTWAAVSGSGGGFSLARTAVKTSNYSAAVNDLIPCDTTSAGFTVTLPTAPADKSLIAVKLVTLGGTNAVTIACGGSDVFNKTSGATTRTLNILNESVLLEYTASGAIWTTVAGDTPLSSLDSRFSAVITAYAQPLDSDLTAIAALSTTSFGRSLLALADAAALTAANNAATTAASGIVELATTAETQTGTDTARAVTPAGASATYQTRTGGGGDAVYALASLTGTIGIDLANGNMHYGTLAGNTTFTFTGATASKECEFVLSITQDSTPRTITWPASVKWAGGAGPTLSTGSGAIDQFVFRSRDGGTTWYGATIGKAFS